MSRGRCTWYTAIKAFPYVNKTIQARSLSGNANEWIASAKNGGHKVTDHPEVWAIVVFSGGYYSSKGHVGYVTEVRDLTITIEEMNYAGRFVVTKRILLRNDPTIASYIILNK